MVCAPEISILASPVRAMFFSKFHGEYALRFPRLLPEGGRVTPALCFSMDMALALRENIVIPNDQRDSCVWDQCVDWTTHYLG